MRRVTFWLVSTVAALMMLFSYHTSTNRAGGTPAAALAPVSPGASTPHPTTSPTAGTSGTGTSGTGTTGTGTSAAATTAAGTSGTFTGGSVDTRWGPVQVQITVADGKITDAQAVVYPQGNHRDIEINDYALPLLQQEAVQAQSAQIDAISGATVTSDGYISSLQSAIDAAHLGG
ncbi:MAG: hypothetical protein V7637_1023 [Mycobacteriales bacterium]|jgi:uncharacterized protein with FMN-binding domain